MAKLLSGTGGGQSRVLDPFGASPRLVREAAEHGCSVVVAVNNPITRFLLRHTLRPFRAEELQSALAALASLRKNGGRLEPFVLDLYRTVCARCGAEVIADYFVWDRELERPVLKAYRCDQCHHSGEEPTTLEDNQRATTYTRHSLQHALALDAVAPPDDPYRRYAETALEVYPARALYALMTMINKVNQLDLSPRPLAAAQALILSGLDAANALWSHGEGRERPRQLIASSRYREINVWRSLEEAILDWALPGVDIPIHGWPRERSVDRGEVALYPGSIRDLAPELQAGEIDRVVTVVPRPNPAYWSLSVLWSAWLWGRGAAGAIKASLARRRYDWGWTAGAFRTVLAELRPAIGEDTLVMSLSVEADPRFLSAVVAGFERAEFQLTGCAFRADIESAVLSWMPSAPPSSSASVGDIEEQMGSAMAEILRRRGEPTPFAVLHAAAWADLSRHRRITQSWQRDGNQALTSIGEKLVSKLSDWQVFKRMDQNVEPERGVYWLANPEGAEAPLADRVEKTVLALLQTEDAVTFLQVDSVICAQMPGLLTPERRLVFACLTSYAEQEQSDGRWRLREQDQGAARELDAEEMRGLLRAMGTQLGYAVEHGETLDWYTSGRLRAYAFRVQETAEFGRVLGGKDAAGVTLVLPGGRASLVAEKARRDARLRAWLKDGVRVLKYRHVRRLAEDSTLKRVNLEERMALDPPESQDSQMPLL